MSVISIVFGAIRPIRVPESSELHFLKECCESPAGCFYFSEQIKHFLIFIKTLIAHCILIMQQTRKPYAFKNCHPYEWHMV